MRVITDLARKNEDPGADDLPDQMVVDQPAATTS